ncbi:uncharacterized protein LOC128191285 [Crassostrea angulata]|uniref:uncharacterized protein LOC128191285 n=1 Tax=Magallana angulata TaxID=2784310 RepID=UPI0022B17B6A|nr:uncharacterized protein LOC128191285 [Crassostrea angulata]
MIKSTATGEGGAAGEVVPSVVPAEQRVGLAPVTTQRHLVVDRTALVPLQVPLPVTPIIAQFTEASQPGLLGEVVRKRVPVGQNLDPDLVRTLVQHTEETVVVDQQLALLPVTLTTVRYMVIGPPGHPVDHARSRAVVARRPGPVRALIPLLSTQEIIVLDLHLLQPPVIHTILQVCF